MWKNTFKTLKNAPINNKCVNIAIVAVALRYIIVCIYNVDSIYFVNSQNKKSILKKCTWK